MYHLATMHSVTDRQTDDCMMPIANHTLICSSTIGKKWKRPDDWCIFSSDWL